MGNSHITFYVPGTRQVGAEVGKKVFPPLQFPGACNHSGTENKGTEQCAKEPGGGKEVEFYLGVARMVSKKRQHVSWDSKNEQKFVQEGLKAKEGKVHRWEVGGKQHDEQTKRWRCVM